ncbi:MAG: hypothetical protein ACT4OX_03070 [Actinomycetota bacterium]
MTYSEGVFIPAAAASLLALDERRWIVAGLWGAAAGLARPNAIASLVGAIVELRRDRRTLAPLAAPALAFAGYALYPLYLWFRVGEPFAYWEVQRDGWGWHFDPTATIEKILDVIGDPGADFNVLMSVLAVAFIAGGFVCMYRWRPPAPIATYTVVLVLLVLSSANLASTWRFAMTAFPLVIAYARVLPTNGYAIALGTSATAMGVLSIASTSALYQP